MSNVCGIDPKLTGKQFEQLILERLQEYRKNNLAAVGRYGVEANHIGKDKIVAVQSKPDFEGVVRGLDSQVIFDAKVCSQASFNLAKYKVEGARPGARSRQLRHMLERSSFGVHCAFLIHWNERQLTKRTYAPETFWLPVSHEEPVWREFLAFERTSINREDCETYGHRVEWNTSERGRKLRPDLLALWMHKF